MILMFVSTGAFASTPMQKFIENVASQLQSKIQICEDLENCRPKARVLVETHDMNIFGMSKMHFKVRVLDGETKDGRDCSITFGTDYVWSGGGKPSFLSHKMDSNLSVFSRAIPVKEDEYKYNQFQIKRSNTSIRKGQLTITPKGGGYGTKANITAKKGEVKASLHRKRKACVSSLGDGECELSNEIITRDYSCTFR